MNKSLYSRFAAFALCLVFAGVLSARVTYTTSVSNSAGITITNATHGMGSPNFGVYIKDNSGVRRPLSEYSWSIDSSTYAVTISFSPNFTGTVKLVGLFPTYTTDDHDFKVTASVGTTEVSVCSGCDTTPAARAYNSQNLVMDGIAVLSFSTLGSDTVDVYLTGRGVVFVPWSGNTTGWSAIGGLVEAGVPGDSLMTLGTVAVDSNGYVALGGVTDYRPW